MRASGGDDNARRGADFPLDGRHTLRCGSHDNLLAEQIQITHQLIHSVKLQDAKATRRYGESPDRKGGSPTKDCRGLDNARGRAGAGGQPAGRWERAA